MKIKALLLVSCIAILAIRATAIIAIVIDYRPDLNYWTDSTVRVLSCDQNAFGDWRVLLARDSGRSMLRFVVRNYHLVPLHHDIYFQLFKYSYIDSLRKKESPFAGEELFRTGTFGLDGTPVAELESMGEAAIKFSVEKPEVYARKKKLIDAADGNLDTKDEAEKIIRIWLLDEHNHEIDAEPERYISSSEYYNYCARMYWP